MCLHMHLFTSALSVSSGCARYSYLKMNAKSQSAKAAASEADKEAAKPLKGEKKSSEAGKNGAEALPQAASLTNGHAHARKSAQ